MAKKIPVTAESLAAQIRESRKRWAQVHAHGTSDPFYHDGTNLNLIRNQILASQERLQALCKTEKAKRCPIEARHKPPKLLSATYMAPGSKAAKHANPVPTKVRKKR